MSAHPALAAARALCVAVRCACVCAALTGSVGYESEGTPAAAAWGEECGEGGADSWDAPDCSILLSSWSLPGAPIMLCRRVGLEQRGGVECVEGVMREMYVSDARGREDTSMEE